MKINFMSRRDFIKTMINQGVMLEDTAVISINNDMRQMSEIQDVLESTGRLIQDDDVIVLRFPDDNSGMTEYQSHALSEFIKYNLDKDFIIHCEMGVSRSGAVAKFINDYTGAKDPCLERYTMYNHRVYRQLMAAAGDSFESYKADLIEQEEKDRSQFNG